MKLNYTATPSIISPESFWLHEEQWVTEGTTDLVDELTRQYTVRLFDTREKAIREGLIALGWTPPPEENIK